MAFNVRALICFFILFLFACTTAKKINKNDGNDFTSYYLLLDSLSKVSTALNSSSSQFIVPQHHKDLDFLNGYKIPTFIANDINGKKIIVDYKDELTLLNFWFTFCKPCIEEIPCINRLQNDNSNKLKIISLCRDPIDIIQKFIVKHPINYLIIPSAVPIIDSTFKLGLGYPINILVDKSGKVIFMTKGFLGVESENYKKAETLIR